MAGISRYEPLGTVIQHIMSKKPNRVLDIGAGFGLLGYLTKAYVDNWFHGKHKTIIDYCDVQEINTDKIKHIYNEFHFVSILESDIDINKYDMIYCFDVLQHLSKSQGNEMLTRLMNYKGNKIVSVPLGNWLRNCANKYESHISKWELKEITDSGLKMLYKYSIKDGRELGIFT